MSVKGFELIKNETVKEVDGEVKLYRHTKTNAELLSVENQDNNKVFAITFKTIPTDSTGLPHILEHSVLCGSKTYPVKDPFMQLLKGSLHTYLNAFTASDHTSYPVASTNNKDFQNLMNVYLDAVFQPLLKEEAFMQEGWRYEVGEDRKLTFNGIVYNEMKGVYSEPMSLLYRVIEKELFPETCYSFESGGDPKDIPDLTYQQYLEYHKSNYHPSNSYIFVYGNFKAEEVFGQIDKHLAAFECSEKAPEIALQPRFEKPVEVEEYYSLSADDEGDDQKEKAFTAISWLLGPRGSAVEEMSLLLLDHVLMMTPASPMKRALIESGLGEGIALWGLDDGMKENTFSTGLRGVALEDRRRVFELVVKTLKELCADGIAGEDIDAALNEVEFSLRENNTGSSPQGFTAMRNAMKGWLYGGDPIEELKFEEVLLEVKKNLKEKPRYLEDMIKRYLLDNQHRVLVSLLPDSQKSKRDQDREKTSLSEKQEEMTPQDLEEIEKKAERVLDYQLEPDSPEALAAIPVLHISEIEKKIEILPTVIDKCGEVEIHRHDLFTNGIVYLNAGLNLKKVPWKLLPYASIYARALKEMGTTEQDYITFNRRISSEIGGLSAGSSVHPVFDSEVISGRFFIHGKAVINRTPQLLSIMKDALLRVNLEDRERFKQIVLESKSAMERRVVPGGAGIVQGRLSSMYDLSASIGERLGGVSQLFFLRDLLKRIEKDWKSVNQELNQLKTALVDSSGLILNVTLPDGDYSDISDQLEAFIKELPAEAGLSCDWEADHQQADELLSAPTEVNYVGKGVKLAKPGKRFPGSTSVILKYLNGYYLWEKIRVQGGAYGAYAGLHCDTGVFTCVSYRDRNLIDTLKVYDQITEHLKGLTLSDAELEKWKIGTISNLDGHLLPDAKGRVALTRYLSGINDDLRQEYRDQVFAADLSDFRSFGEQLSSFGKKGKVSVLSAGEKASDLETDLGKDINVVSVL